MLLQFIFSFAHFEIEISLIFQVAKLLAILKLKKLGNFVAFKLTNHIFHFIYNQIRV